MKDLAGWLVFTSHSLCGDGIALKRSASDIRKAAEAGDMAAVLRECGMLDGRIRVLGRHIQTVSAEAGKALAPSLAVGTPGIKGEP